MKGQAAGRKSLVENAEARERWGDLSSTSRRGRLVDSGITPDLQCPLTERG